MPVTKNNSKTKTKKTCKSKPPRAGKHAKKNGLKEGPLTQDEATSDMSEMVDIKSNRLIITGSGIDVLDLDTMKKALNNAYSELEERSDQAKFKKQIEELFDSYHTLRNDGGVQYTEMEESELVSLILSGFKAFESKHERNKDDPTEGSVKLDFLEGIISEIYRELESQTERTRGY